MIKSWESEHRLSSGRLTKNGEFFHFSEVNGDEYSRFYIYNTGLADTSNFETLRGVDYFEVSDDGEVLAAYHSDGGFSVYSVEQKKAIFDYDRDSVAGGVYKDYALSPDGKIVAMAIDMSDRIDVMLFDYVKGEKRLLKTYPESRR